jgi:hypothetical protein
MGRKKIQIKTITDERNRQVRKQNKNTKKTTGTGSGDFGD